MIYLELPAGAGVRFVTHPKARRGRGVLFATAPFVIYVLTVSALFAAAVQDLSLWDEVKRAFSYGALLAAGLAAACFALGFRMRDDVEADGVRVRITSTPALGRPRARELPFADLRGLAVDPSLRSLGADVLLVAVRRDGARSPIAEGDPHSAQIRDLAARLAALGKVPLEGPASGAQGAGGA
jgi:hypothetical protein